jgi:hypothetical protein
MIFLEYIERDRDFPTELFRHHGGQDWSSPEDRKIANLARTMRLGPVPHYMCWWQISSIARIDEWEHFFRTAEGRLYVAESPVPKVLNFTRNGLYDELIGDGPVSSGLHLAEFFSADDASAEETRRYFEMRAAALGAGRLTYVLKRIGLLAPDPGGVALWSFADYVQAEPFLRAPRTSGPLRIVEAGFYRNFGEDIP